MADMHRNDVLVMVIIVLSILLLSAVTYIAVSRYKEHREKRDNALRQEGYEGAVLQLMQEASACQVVNIYAGNTTMELIALNCLGESDGSFMQDLMASSNKSLF